MKNKDDWNSPDLNVNCNSDSEYKLKQRHKLSNSGSNLVYLDLFYSEFFVHAFANDFSIFLNIVLVIHCTLAWGSICMLLVYIF